MKPIIIARTGSSHLSETISFGMSSEYLWELDELRLHLSTKATASNSLVVTQLSKRGNAYDCVILTQAMVSAQSYWWQSDRPMKFNGKDRLSIAWTNDAASFKTWGLEVVARA